MGTGEVGSIEEGQIQDQIEEGLGIRLGSPMIVLFVKRPKHTLTDVQITVKH